MRNMDSKHKNVIFVGPDVETERERKLKKRVEELREFAIWMTGCGYDFCKHEYFCKQRDKLLLNKEVEDE